MKRTCKTRIFAYNLYTVSINSACSCKYIQLNSCLVYILRHILQKISVISQRWLKSACIDWPQLLVQYHLPQLHTLRCLPSRFVHIRSIRTYQPRRPHAEFYTLPTSARVHQHTHITVPLGKMSFKKICWEYTNQKYLNTLNAVKKLP